jgi:hypothetical protein
MFSKHSFVTCSIILLFLIVFKLVFNFPFSVVISVEGIVKIKTGELLKLSQQQLVDCDKGNNECHKSFVNKAFQCIVENKSLAMYDFYSYTTSKGICRSARMEHFGRISYYVRLHVG